MLGRYIFGSRWRVWIEACLPTTSFSTLVNRALSDGFMSTKGLHEGELLSLMLFVLVVKELTRLILKTQEAELIHGFKVKAEDEQIRCYTMPMTLFLCVMLLETPLLI